MIEKIYYSKNQWCFMLNMGEPELYKNTDEVLKWWKYKMWYEKKRENKQNLFSRFMAYIKAKSITN